MNQKRSDLRFFSLKSDPLCRLCGELMNVSEREVIFREITPVEGFYPVEQDQLGPFVWSRREFIIRKPEGIRYVDLFLCYYGHNGKLVIGKEPAGGPTEITLSRGWIRYAVDLRTLEQCDLDFEVTPLIPVPGEPRELGVMIRHFRAFQDVSVYEHERKKMMNKCENLREFFACGFVAYQIENRHRNPLQHAPTVLLL